MIEGNIQNILTRNRENLLIMFIIKNSDGKYLVTNNPYFNMYSLPCIHIKLTELDSNARGEELSSLIMTFLKREFNFAGIIAEQLNTVQNVDVELNIDLEL